MCLVRVRLYDVGVIIQPLLVAMYSDPRAFVRKQPQSEPTTESAAMKQRVQREL